MKRMLIILAMILILTGCSIYEETPTQVTIETPVEEVKPLTKQVCDILGFMSSEIIEEQAQQGYMFTGRTRGLFCENMLNFQLKEGN